MTAVQTPREVLADLWRGAGGDPGALDDVTLTGDEPQLPSSFRIAAAALIMLGCAVALSWSRYGRQVVSLGALAYAPFYALWKLPVYLKFLTGRQVEWVRSKRDKP